MAQAKHRRIYLPLNLFCLSLPCYSNFKIILLILGLGYSSFIHAQDDECQKKVWEKVNEWNQYKNPENGTPTEIAQKKKFLSAIHTMIQGNSTTRGVRCGWSYVLPSAMNGIPVVYFSYGILAQHYYCAENKLQLTHETSTSLNVMINQFLETSLFDTTTDEILTGYRSLRHKIPVEIRPGIWRFPDEPEPLGFGMTGTSKLWLITQDGQLPWRYVTRKEFLVKRRTNLLKMKSNEAPRLKESLQSWETEKKYKEDQWKNEPAKLKSYLDHTYTPAIKRTREVHEKTMLAFDAAIERVDEALAGPEHDLVKKAIVVQDPNNHLNYNFVEEEGPFTEVLTMPNPAYFKKGLARTIPQLISIEIIYNHNDETASEFAKQMQQALNLDQLRSFIGKAAPPLQP